MLPLPIDPFLPQLVTQLQTQTNLVLVAEPGAGKTTRLPRAMLEAGLDREGEILVLEPRRIAARMAAARVAQELGEPVGRRVGYQVRFEERSSAATRVRFVTEGVLSRRLIAEPSLPGVGAVLLDEFHERHLQGDLALALLRRLQKAQRPELRLCAMSATLEAAKVAEFLGCEVANVPGRRFDVRIEHLDKPDSRPLEQQVLGAARRLVREGNDGHVLVFLPGAAEIRRARDALEPLAREHGLLLTVLHGDLTPDEQDRALASSQARKLILSTNLAESSVTIDGVSAVIDSGLARVAGHSAWSGLSTLETAPISRASATQRAGRAGRVREGRCLRLYTRADHDARPLHDKPEIARADLCETWLGLRAIDAQLEQSDWLTAPPDEAWKAAHALNRWLGSVDAEGRITPIGQRMLRFPLHPRLSRILTHAAETGMGARGATLVALLAEREISTTARARFDGRVADVARGPSDALDRLERFEEAEDASFAASAMRALELDGNAVRTVARTRDRLRHALGVRGRVDVSRGPGDEDEALLRSLLTGFGDRVGKRREVGSREIVLARGGSTTLSETSVVRDAPFVIVLDASERGRTTVAHLVSAIEPEWLLELFEEFVTDETLLTFDGTTERVEAVHALRYAGLTLDESRAPANPGPDTERVLFEAALARGQASWGEDEALTRFERRANYAAEVSKSVPRLPEDARRIALANACAGLRSFAELRTRGVMPALQALVPPAALAEIEHLAPESIALASGRRLSVHYEADRPPFVASRLQDFFGSKRGPDLGGRPLVLHLLAPNQRPVQVTTDLASFWAQHYPELRRQLMRRYPRHSWPEDPLTASPPAPSPPRRRP